jgi:hypothetical protein
MTRVENYVNVALTAPWPDFDWGSDRALKGKN